MRFTSDLLQLGRRVLFVLVRELVSTAVVGVKI